MAYCIDLWSSGVVNCSVEVDLPQLLQGVGELAADGQGNPVPPVLIVDLDDADWTLVPAVVHVLQTHRHGLLIGRAYSPLPMVAAPLLELLTTTVAPSGPGRTWVPETLAAPEQITAAITASPFAALTLAGLLELTSALPVAEGLVAESLAYSMLLSGPEFLSWRESTPRRPVPWAEQPVLLERNGDELEVTLNRPRRHNAFGRQVRDGLLEALTVAELDSTVVSVRLCGAGPSFCSGGDLDEFGTAAGAAAAHVVRLAYSAGHAVHRLRDRVIPELHGACIGAGIEVPAFAIKVLAHPGSFFALPEVSMGLIPGAGGTVSITRRIGRWRTAWMALTGARVDLETALAWGLVDGRA